jgi:beta-galactosidase
VTLAGWEIYTLPCEMTFTTGLKFIKADSIAAPGFFRGTFSVQKLGDTFLDMSGWKKGVVWVSFRNLGRYWSIGPQQCLYLPGPWLQIGTNEIIIVDPEMAKAVPVRAVSLR